MINDQAAAELFSIPDAQERQAWLAVHPEHFSLETIRALKTLADRAERDDARQALQIGQIAEEVADALQDDAGRGLAVWAQANAHDCLAEYDRAVQEYDRAAALFLQAGLDLEAARTRIGQVAALKYLGQFEQAQALAEAARQVFITKQDTLSLAKMDMNLGNLYARRGQPQLALDHFRQALLAYRSLGNDLHAGFAEVNQANVLTLLDDFVNAEQLYSSARATFETTNLRSTVAMVDHDVAFLLYARGQYAEALRLFERARAAFTALAIPMKIAYMDLNESDVYLDLNLPEDTLRLALQAEDTFRTLKMNFEIGRAQLNQAAALARLGERHRSLALLKQARDLFAAEDNDVWLAHSDLQQAEVLSRMATSPLAHTLAIYAAGTYQRLGLKTKQAYALLLAADLFIRDNQWAAASDRLQQVREALTDITAPWLHYRLDSSYGQIYEGLGDASRAIWHYQRAAEQAEQMAVTIPAEEQRTAFVADKLAPYEGLVSLTAAQSASEAFSWAERARSRALVDLLAAGVRPRLRMIDEVDLVRGERLNKLREELNWLYTRLTRGTTSSESGLPPAGPEVWEKIHAREREVTALWHDLQAKHAEALSLQRVAPLRVEEVQAGLPDGTLLVEYFIARDQVWAFVLSREWVSVQAGLCSMKALRPLLESLSFQISKGQYGSDYFQRHRSALLMSTHDILAQLFQLLLAPLWSQLVKAEALIIVPHGPLHRLPFHALELDNRPLIETHTVSYAPSAAALQFCREKQPVRDAPAVLLGVPDHGIARVGDELRALAQFFPQAISLIGPDATVAQLQQYAPTCSVLHLATHGLFRPEAPLLSGLQLADRWLAVQDIYDLSLKASLVTISACDSGLGRVTGGDELVGLVRGFLYAGAASLLVSLWMVDDEAIARFTIEFYRAWQRGLPKAQALRQVQRAFWQEYQHPFYWAPLVLVGSER